MLGARAPSPTMGYSLRPGVTCCQTDRFTFFLDTDRDRYFAIGGQGAEAFARLVSGAEKAEDGVVFGRLVDDSMLIVTPDPTSLAFCRRNDSATDSALDRPPERRFKPPAMAALIRLWLARRSMRRHGLAGALRTLADRKAGMTAAATERHDVLDVAASFERCKNVVSPLDQCLPHSIAVAQRLLDIGVVPSLIIGVRAQPFAAHCWVEAGGLIVSDRHDTVRAFSPILVI